MPLICTSCRVSFVDENDMRSHYKSAWHTYNAKRQLCKLPVVSKEAFLSNEAVVRREENSEVKEKGEYCEACSKRFTSAITYENHKKSKRHLQNLERHSAKPASSSSKPSASRMESKVSVSTDGDDDRDDDGFGDGEALGLEECFFCSNIAESTVENVDHMAKTHSFFIPDVEYLTDLEGLVAHIGEKIGLGHMCLWCNEKSKMFYSVDAVQKHMRDKGHCKLMYDGDATLEYADFYDYSPSWEGAGVGPEESDEEIEDNDLPDNSEADEDSYEMTLPSGATIGHRSLLRYYKQRLAPERQVQLHRAGQSKVNVVLSQYKAIGWRSETAIRKQQHHDMAYLQREKLRYRMKLGVKANKFQKHFRPQVIF